jgi:hypothetical protein
MREHLSRVNVPSSYLCDVKIQGLLPTMSRVEKKLRIGISDMHKIVLYIVKEPSWLKSTESLTETPYPRDPLARE